MVSNGYHVDIYTNVTSKPIIIDDNLGSWSIKSTIVFLQLPGFIIYPLTILSQCFVSPLTSVLIITSSSPFMNLTSYIQTIHSISLIVNILLSLHQTRTLFSHPRDRAPLRHLHVLDLAFAGTGSFILRCRRMTLFCQWQQEGWYWRYSDWNTGTAKWKIMYRNWQWGEKRGIACTTALWGRRWDWAPLTPEWDTGTGN